MFRPISPVARYGPQNVLIVQSKCRLSCCTSELAPLLRRARRHRRGGSQMPQITTGDGGAIKFVQGLSPPSRTSSLCS